MLLLVLAACDGVSEGELALTDTVPYVEGEVLLRIDGDDVDAMRVEEENGLEEAERIDALGVKRVRVPEGKSVRSVVEKLSEDHRVAFAEPNVLVRAMGSDPYRFYQWNLDEIGVDAAWAAGGTGGGVVVAVLDTGVAKGAPDGVATLLPGYDFYYGDADATDGNGHGTFVAGTIAQSTGNGVGVSGVAPGASILPVKVMGDDGMGDVGAIANGIVWAADQGADVINMSLGSAYPSSTLERACEYAFGKGVVLVAATGNEYAASVGYPAAYETVIAVGATGYGGERAPYSNRGTGIDLVAPGGDLSKDRDGDGYADGILQETFEGGYWTYTFWEGTSMATPHVAAVAALVVAQGVSDPAEVYDVLTSTAVDRGSSGYDTSYGYGSVDAAAAVERAAGGSSGGTSGGTDSGGGDSGGTSGGTDSGGADTAPAVDTTPPLISDVSGYTQSRSFTIQWVTDEPADSYVSFDGYGTYGDAALTTSHTLTFNGQRGATYTFTVESTDAAGNTATDGSWQIRL